MENQELEVVSKFVFSPEVFDPNVEQLEAIKKEVSTVTADPKNITKEELELVSDTRKNLMKARTRIKSIGKSERDASNKYSKDVIAYEKSLIEIIEPEEQRLKDIEDQAKAHLIREARRETLPEYKEKLLSINGQMPKITDDELLDMDPTQFQEFYNDCREEHFNTLEAEKEEREAAEAKAKEEEDKKKEQERLEIEREKENLAKEKFNNRVQRLLTLGMKESGSHYTYGQPGEQAKAWVEIAEVKNCPDEAFDDIYSRMSTTIAEAKEIEAKEAKKAEETRVAEAAAKAKEEAEIEAKRIADEKEAKRLADEKAEKEAKEAEEAKAAADKLERESAERFQNWLAQFSYNESTDKLIEENGITTLYRKVDEYHHNQ